MPKNYCICGQMFEIYYTVNNTEFFVLLRKSFGVLAQHINIISLFTSAQLTNFNQNYSPAKINWLKESGVMCLISILINLSRSSAISFPLLSSHLKI